MSETRAIRFHLDGRVFVDDKPWGGLVFNEAMGEHIDETAKFADRWRSDLREAIGPYYDKELSPLGNVCLLVEKLKRLEKCHEQ